MDRPKADKPHGRRPRPSNRTGFESDFLQDRVRSGVKLVFSLIDGRSLEGRVTAYDPDYIEIESPGGGSCRLRKSEIRYISE